MGRAKQTQRFPQVPLDNKSHFTIFYLLTAFIKQNSPWIRHLIKHFFSLVHACDTSGSSRAASAGADRGAARQNSCFLLKGRQTHKIKALSNPKPRDHLTLPTGFPLLAHEDGFSSLINHQLQFGTGTHTHTNPPFS